VPAGLNRVVQNSALIWQDSRRATSGPVTVSEPKRFTSHIKVTQSSRLVLTPKRALARSPVEAAGLLVILAG
jgi:hypothetical protein